MFSRLRDPNGRFSLLMTGLALVALSGFLLFLPLPLFWLVVLGGGTFALGVGCIIIGWQQRRNAQYDLSRLWEEPPPEPEEPYEDSVREDEIGAPYCGWCDEAYRPGTQRCIRCGRELG